MFQRKVRDARDARACLEAVETSGMTRRAWAQAHGVDARSLHAWHVNLTRSRGAVGRPGPRLVELVPAGRPPEPARYRILCGDMAVEVEDGFDADVLRRLLAVVGAC